MASVMTFHDPDLGCSIEWRKGGGWRFLAEPSQRPDGTIVFVIDRVFTSEGGARAAYKRYRESVNAQKVQR